MAIEIFLADEQTEYPVDSLRWIRLAEAVILDEAVPGDAELSMLFVDEDSMTILNKRYRNKDGPTDVLAFPIDEEPVEGGRSPDSGGTGPGDASEPSDLPTMLGDVVICPAVAHRNAPEHGGRFEDEVALLIVHGVLHLLGMDHEDDEEAEAMEERERVLLDKFHRPPREGGEAPTGAGAALTGDGRASSVGPTEAPSGAPTESTPTGTSEATATPPGDVGVAEAPTHPPPSPPPSQSPPHPL
ncbi:MAG: rRNA maturation RNase YbeY [Acidimicrobiales bacterium]